VIRNPKKPAKIVPKNAPKAPAPIKASPKPFKFHPERIEAASTNKFEDPEMAKLNLALEAVKEDILSTNKQITDERKWVIAVAKIIASYNDKMKRVEAHIIALRKEMKALYRKKKQIENLKLQKALESKLKEARDELATLTHSLKHVAVKQGELNRSGADLRQTIAGIQAQLAKLRGQQLRSPRPAPRMRCKKGLRYSKKAKKCVARKARRVARKAGKKL
jgi:predicted  nucleic acid-binding Zn-ribbon protein